MTRWILSPLRSGVMSGAGGMLGSVDGFGDAMEKESGGDGTEFDAMPICSAERSVGVRQILSGRLSSDTSAEKSIGLLDWTPKSSSSSR